MFQRLLGEATAYVDTAEAALHQVARMWTELARRSMETDVLVSDADDRRLVLIEQQVVELASKAVEAIFRTSGSSASNRGQRIERYFRDLSMIRTHADAPVRAQVGECRPLAARPPATDAVLNACLLTFVAVGCCWC